MRRVLIIEDNRDAAEVLSLMLQVRGHRVLVAHSGSEGLQQAAQFQPQVVICDIGLPGETDGYAVARTIRADGVLAAISLIALSGYGADRDKERASEAGFDAHLTKPPDPDQLLRLIEYPPWRQ